MVELEKSAHTLSWNETNHFVLEWNSGIGTTIRTANLNSLEVIWIVNSGRTSEINTPSLDHINRVEYTYPIIPK